MIKYRLPHHGRFFWLLISLVLSLVASALLQQHVFFQWVSLLLLLFVLTTAILAIRESLSILTFMTILAMLTFILSLTDLVIGDIFSEFLSKSFLAIFCIILIVSFSKDILKSKAIIIDMFFGAICVYLLIAITFALFYNITNILDPNSFYMLTSGARLPPTEFDFFYFSFTTLTTVGYGDVAIVSPHAKTLVVIESITGIFYLAILVSCLVARHGSSGD
ncbi:MAG: ion channel [Gammaproteobacteria bacterium]|jgi:hypothetical protein